MGELPAALFKHVGDSLGIRRINGHGGAGAGVMDKLAKIITATGELGDIEMGHGSAIHQV